MKKLIFTCHEPQGESLEYVFKDSQIPFYKEKVKSDEIELFEYTAIAPDNTARVILEKSSKILDTKHKEVMITSQTLDATFSDYLANLEEQEKEKNTGILTEEFHAISEPSVEFNKDLFAMVIIASVAAVIGLFSNNAALVIGGMLLAPLIGPMTAFSFNAAVGHPRKMAKASVNGASLLIAAFATAALLTLVVSQFVELPITDEILLRTETSFVFLALAIALGVAGGIAMSSGVPGILVGVAIAAALVPPSAVAGIGLALWDFDIFTNSLLLTI
ncbi:MAG: TIGR00341 family protein, partial [Nitrosopumilus sp.]